MITNQNKLIKIRKAHWEDMPKIARFIRSSADWYEKIVDEKDLGEHNVDFYWKTRNYKLRDFYIGQASNEKEFGTISVQYFGDITYIGYIYLDIKYVGHGYGRKLIEFAKKKSLERNQKSLILLAHPEAKWAVKAYRKYGFKCILKNKTDILAFKGGILKSYYEEGFYLFEYPLEYSDP